VPAYRVRHAQNGLRLHEVGNGSMGSHARSSPGLETRGFAVRRPYETHLHIPEGTKGSERGAAESDRPGTEGRGPRA
jgi:hypothetical protein